jgi:hypothetical protein
MFSENKSQRGYEKSYLKSFVNTPLEVQMVEQTGRKGGFVVHNKLECLSLTCLSSLVYCMWVSPGAYPSVKHLKCASLM